MLCSRHLCGLRSLVPSQLQTLQRSSPRKTQQLSGAAQGNRGEGRIQACGGGSSHQKQFFSTSPIWPLEKLLNLKKYPIHDSNDIRMHQLVQKCQNGLHEDGYFFLPHFVHEEALAVLFESCLAHEGICNLSESFRTIWNQPPQSSFNPVEDEQHADPSNLSMKVSKCVRGMVAMDELSATGPLRTLYASDELKHFLSLVRDDGERPLCRLEDDLASCSVGIYGRGHSEHWAFNRHALTAHLVVQESNVGGRVQVLKNAWSPLQQHDKLVSAVVHTLLCANEAEHVGLELDIHWPLAEIFQSMDESEQPTFFFKGPLAVKNIVARAGGLLVTVGKQSLFRVAPAHGDEALVLGVLRYEDAPGYRYHDQALAELFGRKRAGEPRQEPTAMGGGEHKVFGYDDAGELVEMESPDGLDMSEVARMAGMEPGPKEDDDEYSRAKSELEEDLGMAIEEGKELTEEELHAAFEQKQ